MTQRHSETKARENDNSFGDNACKQMHQLWTNLFRKVVFEDPFCKVAKEFKWDQDKPNDIKYLASVEKVAWRMLEETKKENSRRRAVAASKMR